MISYSENPQCKISSYRCKLPSSAETYPDIYLVSHRVQSELQVDPNTSGPRLRLCASSLRDSRRLYRRCTKEGYIFDRRVRVSWYRYSRICSTSEPNYQLSIWIRHSATKTSCWFEETAPWNSTVRFRLKLPTRVFHFVCTRRETWPGSLRRSDSIFLGDNLKRNLRFVDS